MASLRVNAASWDTQHMLPYSPHRKSKAPKNPTSAASPQTPPSPSPTTSFSKPNFDVTDLLKRKNHRNNQEKLEELYMGFDVWLPNPPKVEKPRSVFNAVSLAYIGDSVFELYARRHFLFPPLSIDEHNDRVMAVVRCEAQDALLQKLIDDDYLTKEEREVLRWGKNVGSSPRRRSKKRAGIAVHRSASSLETLVGFLYLTNGSRLEEVMAKLGFLAGASTESILETEAGQ